MRHYKLPFSISLEYKYDDINIDNFPKDWRENRENRKERKINLDNALHIELGKFGTYDIPLDEIVDLALRFALQKREFRRMCAMHIENKQQNYK